MPHRNWKENISHILLLSEFKGERRSVVGLYNWKILNKLVPKILWLLTNYFEPIPLNFNAQVSIVYSISKHNI
jgi:hypothetical protein